ncbi:MAG: alpha/beta fold hydrolase [Gemmataceae bacterium]|nr:alpha/beta fold hydrolase [Gemmataceae bacterium]
MRSPIISLALSAAFTLPLLAQDKADDLDTRARALVTALTKDDFKAAAKDFDDTMKKVLPPAKLEETWKALRGQVGAFQKVTGVRREKKDKYEFVIVTCQFEKAALDARVVFDADKQIAGLFFAPAASAEYKTPAYVKRDAFDDTEVKVGTAEWVLPGTLSKPKGTGPFAAVVLVHGSGPNDRDETLGPNRPFRDLAWGLASRGIAVLRYEKRTREHGTKLAKIKDLTVKEEVTDDALAAVKLLQRTPGIDPKKVFVLGHSLGAMLAPRIGEQDPSIAGLILLGAPTRPLEDLILEQLTYLVALNQVPMRSLDAIREQVARVKDPKLSPDTPDSDLPLGMPAPYWLALRPYKPAEVAVKLKQPLLILQGERDYQVTMTDFAGWKKALTDRKNVELKSYPKLNHLFMEGVGKSKPEEYQKVGSVSPEVIEDIGGWVKKQ